MSAGPAVTRPTASHRHIWYAVVAVLGLAGIVTAGLHGADGLRLALVLLGMAVVPGTAVLLFVRPRSGYAEMALTTGVSFSIWVLGATAMATTHLWFPWPFYAVVTGLSTLLVARAALVTARRRAAEAGDPGGEEQAAPSSGRWRSPRSLLHVFLLLDAVVLWGVAVERVHVAPHDLTGLAPHLPVTFWVALLIVNVGFVVELLDRARGFWLGAYTAAFIMLVHGLPAAAYSFPRYPWTYKHLGVVDYIASHGGINRSIDLFQNWPGMFAAAAALAAVTGVSLLAYAGWAEVVFDIASVAALLFVLAELTSRRIRAMWLGAWLFVSFNWVGQDYFSPQGLSFGLVLVALALVLSLPGNRAMTVSVATLLAQLRRLLPHRRAVAEVGDGADLCLDETPRTAAYATGVPPAGRLGTRPVRHARAAPVT